MLKYVQYYFRSVSVPVPVPRKWNPPAFINLHDKNTFDNSSDVKPVGILASRSSTPKIRIGLSRNYKSPKPLHTNIKWTPNQQLRDCFSEKEQHCLKIYSNQLLYTKIFVTSPLYLMRIRRNTNKHFWNSINVIMMLPSMKINVSARI